MFVPATRARAAPSPPIPVPLRSSQRCRLTPFGASTAARSRHARRTAAHAADPSTHSPPDRSLLSHACTDAELPEFTLATPAPPPHARAAAPAASPPPEPAGARALPDAWWRAQAALLDARAAELARLEARLRDAVAAEAFEAAGALRARVAALRGGDALTQVRAALAAAVRREDFVAAAALRDASHAGLRGWWRTAASARDPWGHLVHVAERHGRLCARAYSPAHVAAMHGWRRESPYHSSVGNAQLEESGVPLFELLLHRGSSGSVKSHVFFLPDAIPAHDRLGYSVLRPAAALEPLSPPCDAANDSEHSCTTLDRAPCAPAASAVCDAAPTGTSAPPRGRLHDEGHGGEGGARARQREGQLAPGDKGTFAQPLAPTIAEAVRELDRAEADAMVQELTRRASLAEAPESEDAAPPQATRVSAEISDQHRSRFTLTIPGACRGGSPERVTYERLDAGVASGAAAAADPFTGYFLGSFGVHGPELLHLQRGLWDGEEAVIAHKVTGDPRVRAGQVSFRAKLAPPAHAAAAAAHAHGYPRHMDVVAHCAGEGCVSEPGTDKEREWCEGDLLAFGERRSSDFRRLTGGAGLGFIWKVEHSRRFLILLSRVDLPQQSA